MDPFRTKLFDVPGVEVLMGDKTEKPPVRVGVLEDEGPRPEDRRIDVFRAAAGVGRAVNEKEIMLVGVVSPEIFFCLDDPGDVTNERIGIPVSLPRDAEDIDRKS